MQRESGLLQVDRIVGGRRFRRLAHRVEVVDETTSTNDDVLLHQNNPDGDGLVIFAERQTAGRGRLGRIWHSPRGASVICSVLLVDAGELALPSASGLALIGGIAAADAVLQSTGVCATLVWPNDVYVDNRKVGGVLVESRTRADRRRIYALGIGINCLQQPGHFERELHGKATSLYMASCAPIEREAVAAALLSNLDLWLSQAERWTDACIRAAYQRCAAPLGGTIRIRANHETYAGSVLDIDATGGLLVQLADGTRKVFDAATSSIVSKMSNEAP